MKIAEEKRTCLTFDGELRTLTLFAGLAKKRIDTPSVPLQEDPRNYIVPRQKRGLYLINPQNYQPSPTQYTQFNYQPSL